MRASWPGRPPGSQENREHEQALPYGGACFHIPKRLEIYAKIIGSGGEKRPGADLYNESDETQGGECRMKNLPITVEALRPVAGVKIMK